MKRDPSLRDSQALFWLPCFRFVSAPFVRRLCAKCHAELPAELFGDQVCGGTKDTE